MPITAPLFPQQLSVPEFADIVHAYGLTMLREDADFSLENGDLALTKDGDIKIGDNACNSLFRLVQTWRYNEPHMRYLFETTKRMRAEQDIDEKLNAITVARSAQIKAGAPARATEGRDWTEFAAAICSAMDDNRIATAGAAMYGGCLMLILSGMLLRFRDDIEAKSDWISAGHLFNENSVGVVITAAANGFRHADEWAKTHPPTTQQRASQDILNALSLGGPRLSLHRVKADEPSPGSCVEALLLLSGGDFEGLALNIFAFARDLALRARSRTAAR